MSISTSPPATTSCATRAWLWASRISWAARNNLLALSSCEAARATAPLFLCPGAVGSFSVKVNCREGTMKRRDFLTGTGGLVAASAALAVSAQAAQPDPQAPQGAAPRAPAAPSRAFNSPYRGQHLDQIAFPLGGIGAGMICLEGVGALSHVSIRNRPEIFNEPCVFAALAIKGDRPVARVLEGPVPGRKLFGPLGSAIGSPGTTYGLPRFAEAQFESRFPFAKVTLGDPSMPLNVEITGWS